MSVVDIALIRDRYSALAELYVDVTEIDHTYNVCLREVVAMLELMRDSRKQLRKRIDKLLKLGSGLESGLNVEHRSNSSIDIELKQCQANLSEVAMYLSSVRCMERKLQGIAGGNSIQ
jgi:hypothetical protein